MVVALGVLVAVGLMFVFFLAWGSTHPYVHRIAAGRLTEFITNVYRRGYQGGLAVVRDRGKHRFVRLNKYILEDGRLGLNLYLPTSLWTPEEHQRLQSMISDRGLRVGSTHLREPESLVPFPVHWYNHQRAMETNFSPMEVIDCGADVPLCSRLVEDIFSVVLDRPTESGYLFEMWGVSLHNELIDRHRPQQT